MASRDNQIFPHSTDTDAFPQQPDADDTESVLSSRMTDIASEDGGDRAAEYAAPSTVYQSYRRGSAQTGDGASRPGTAVTGVSSTRGGWSQVPPSRRGGPPPLSGQIKGGMAGSTAGARPSSATSRTHVPSLSSHAFFRPMSSQRLQAQRKGSRPSISHVDRAMEEMAAQGQRPDSVTSDRTVRMDQSRRDEERPPTRGTELSEPVERMTANASPTTQGHAPSASLTESVQPLQRNPNTKNLTLNVDNTNRHNGGIPTPSKSPRSFRSSFLLPNRGDVAPNSPNRVMKGREKLSSVASSPGLTETHAKPTPNKAQGSNYQYFTGNTVFCWGGRLQNTRDKPINIATGFLVILPGVLFFIFSAPWLWHNVSPAIPIIIAYTFYICLSSFIHASLSDPGILPRNLHPMPPISENEDPLTLGPPTNDWALIKSATSSAAAMEVPIKYCKTCNIWRPPRAHHCRSCDSCIETQDHHCVWINNCVGRRNYRYFVTFLTTSTFFGLFILAASLAQILDFAHLNHTSFGKSIAHFKVPFAMLIYSILATPYPAALMGYHFFLMARGETTREYLNGHKFLPKDRHRAFTQGNILKNWLVVLCRPRPPTYLRFKNVYEDGDQRFGERKGKRAAVIKEEYRGRGVPAGTGGEMEMQSRERERGFQGPGALRMEART